MPENLIDMVRSRIEAIRGQSTSRQGVLETARERITKIRERGIAGVREGGLLAQGGIVERIGERFPALKRARGQLEPWERPALFERASARGETMRKEIKKQIAGVEVTEEAKRAALF